VDDLTTVGFVFQDRASGLRVGYLPDIRRLDDAGKARLTGAAVVLIGAVQLEARAGAHLPVAAALALCRELDIAQPILTHIGHLRLTMAQLRTWLDQAGYPAVQVAQDGLVITVAAGQAHLTWPSATGA
jgi:hypothetical protein